MKLGFFNEYRLGVVKGDTIVDIQPVLGSLGSREPQDLIAQVISAWDDLKDALEAYAAGHRGEPLASVRLRAPLPRPSKIVCMAVNYLENTGGSIPDIDAFLKDSDCVIGDGDTVFLDPKCNARIFHHEAELAVVIGKAAVRVEEAQAMDHVFGYTGFVDVSARIAVRGSQSYFQAKSWPTFGPTGPFIVTKDEVPDPHGLRVALRNNDVVFPGFSTAEMAHRIPECVAFSSRILPLGPGDIISTGTNHQNLGPMQDGDQFEMDIEAIGALRFRVEDPLKREWPRGRDEEMAARMRGEGRR